MKRWNELDNEALALLDEEAIERYTEIELAHAGIMPVSPPPKEDTTHPNTQLTKDDKFFEVNGMLFRNEEDALTFSKMDVYKEDYDYSTGYDYKYATPTRSPIAPVFLYRKEEVDRYHAIIVNHKEAKEARDEHEKEFNEFKKASNKIRTEIWNGISAARDEVRKVDQARDTFHKYVELANGDKKVAIKFFKKTYAEYDELIAAIVGDDELTANIVAEKITEDA